MDHRDALEHIWRAGVLRVGGHESVSLALKNTPKADGIISIGKAATPMMEAALSHSGYDTRSLLVTKYNHVICKNKFNQARIEEYQEDGTLEVIEAAHPVPDKNSLVAGEALIKFVKSMDSKSHLLVLISGGASALAECPQPDVNLDDLTVLTENMLAEGLDIAAINAERKRYSLIKDGKLLALFSGLKLSVLAISDVQGDNIEDIGSGLGMTHRVRPGVDHQTHIVATNKLAREGCVEKARMLGFDIQVNQECAYGDVDNVGSELADYLIKGGKGIYVFGGEPTVLLPANPGRGGRNQHLALLMAQKLSGEHDIEFLIAGTDGTDGPTLAAGGFGDGRSFNQIPGGEGSLANADAGAFLEKSGDLFVTGPTGTNVMDLIVAINS